MTRSAVAGAAAAAAGVEDGRRWATDFPDSDLNFSWRLHEATSLKVNPKPISMRLTDPSLFDYPFIYLIEPGLFHSRPKRERSCASICSMAAS